MNSAPACVCIGGDARMLYLAGMLQKDGYTVTLCGMERAEYAPCCQSTLSACRFADCVILPVPAIKEGYINAPWGEKQILPEDVLSRMSPNALLAGGCIPKETVNQAESRGLCVFDYYAHPGVIERNCVPTAEGAIALAMERSPITIHKSRCLVIGYGRVGKALSRRLAALGARVSVSARRDGDIAAIEGAGMEALLTPGLGDELARFDFIFNTVPAPVLGAAALEKVSKKCLLIELASSPGGIDRAAAEAGGRNYFAATGLPGKAAPLTAAGIIRDALVKRIEERRSV